MPLNSPGWEFVTWWKCGACPPAWDGPLILIVVRGVPGVRYGPRVLSRMHGLRASAWAKGAGIKVLVSCALRCRGMRPAAKVLAVSLGLQPEGFLLPHAAARGFR